MTELTDEEKRERLKDSLLSGGERVKKGGGCHDTSWVRFIGWVAEKFDSVFRNTG